MANLAVAGAFAAVVAASYVFGYRPGMELGRNSWAFTKTMILMFPGAFILIGLFEAWIDRAMVEKHLGDTSGFLGYFWVLLLAFTVMAPMIIALPIAKSLSEKGARLQVVMGFLGFSTVCRIPMSIFEATYLGIPFSLVRFAVSLPLIIISSEILGRLFVLPAVEEKGLLID
jgi:uncharacterized membrane protein YraQ (UPF0718 family)